MNTTPIDTLLLQAQQALQAGQPEAALPFLQQALAQQPHRPDLRVQCAAILGVLQQPQAAHQLMLQAREQLLGDADGACNLAITAEAAGLVGDAIEWYRHALSLQPQHVRALTNLSALAAAAHQWPEAVTLAQQARALSPGDMGLWLNVCDFLTGSGREDEALASIEEACHRFPDDERLAIRRVVASSLAGRWQEGERLLAGLGTSAARQLDAMLRGRARPGPESKANVAWYPLDLRELFLAHVFERLRRADTRQAELAGRLIGELLAEFNAQPGPRDWRDVQFHALQLPVDEATQRGLWHATMLTLRNRVEAVDIPPVARRLQAEGPVRVGLALPPLRDERRIDHLICQLSLHDRQHFRFFVYLSEPRQRFAAAQTLDDLGVGCIGIDHFSVVEAVQRIRLDELDVFVDWTFYDPSCRSEILNSRVAPVHMRHQSWHRHQATAAGPQVVAPCEYTVGDAFTHPGTEPASIQAEFGAVVRFPGSCWLAMPPSVQPAPRNAARRAAVGLPEQACVMAAWMPALYIDNASFAAWCQVLREQAHTLLWLPPMPIDTAANLRLRAQAHGVAAERLVFAQPAPRLQLLTDLCQADLFVDSTRYSASAALADALHLGLPALAFGGGLMPSRLGGSLLHAAGLGDQVSNSIEDYAARLGRLCSDASERQRLSERLQRLRSEGATPLFQPEQQVRHWELAWAEMARRQRSGLAHTAFDVEALKP